jgi:serine protease AprX
MARSKWLNALHVRGSVSDINTLAEFPFVQYIQFANPALNQSLDFIPAFKTGHYNKQTETMADFSYGTSANQINMLQGHLLHQQDFTGSGKIIAVMDAGFPGVDTEEPFERLHTNNLILGGYNFVGRNANYYTGGSHGTMVLSTMGGYADNSLVGTAPDASYYLFITEDTSAENPIEESLWVEAAEVADSLGVDIINTSLGYFFFDNPGYNHTYSDMNGHTAFISRGAAVAASRGMVVVVSAGNSGAGSDPFIAAPADAEGILTVGAVTPAAQYASFSSIGPTADGRIKPDVMAQGQSAVIAGAEGTVGTANGTSFSSPIIAGMVACLWQALPQKTAGEIIQLIKESAHLYNNPNNQFGFGIPNYQLALLNGLTINEIRTPVITAYPNPVEDYFLVQMNDGSALTGDIEIINAVGQTVIRSHIPTQGRIDMANLSSGLYLYKIYTAGETISGKIIKR